MLTLPPDAQVMDDELGSSTTRALCCCTDSSWVGSSPTRSGWGTPGGSNEGCAPSKTRSMSCAALEMPLPQSPMALSPMSSLSHEGASTNKLWALDVVAAPGPLWGAWATMPATLWMRSSRAHCDDSTAPCSSLLAPLRPSTRSRGCHAPPKQFRRNASMREPLQFCISSLIKCKMHLAFACSRGP
jgi:hypothetical protein